MRITNTSIKNKVTARSVGTYKNGYKDGYHLNSSYWKYYKKTITEQPPFIMEVQVGVMLGDANMYKTQVGAAKIKMEQGFVHLYRASL